MPDPTLSLFARARRPLGLLSRPNGGLAIQAAGEGTGVDLSPLSARDAQQAYKTPPQSIQPALDLRGNCTTGAAQESPDVILRYPMEQMQPDRFLIVQGQSGKRSLQIGLQERVVIGVGEMVFGARIPLGLGRIVQ
jgi:hypothetical protein